MWLSMLLVVVVFGAGGVASKDSVGESSRQAVKSNKGSSLKGWFQSYGHSTPRGSIRYLFVIYGNFRDSVPLFESAPYDVANRYFIPKHPSRPEEIIESADKSTSSEHKLSVRKEKEPQEHWKEVKKRKK